jgi:hypothetical protein
LVYCGHAKKKKKETENENEKEKKRKMKPQIIEENLELQNSLNEG